MRGSKLWLDYNKSVFIEEELSERVIIVIIRECAEHCPRYQFYGPCELYYSRMYFWTPSTEEEYVFIQPTIEVSLRYRYSK